jgi:2,4-dienoyl-CoA reductase (NADPH2)
VLAGGAPVGGSVAIIGAGGIGFDVAEFLSHDAQHPASSLSPAAFALDWGIDMSLQARGGVAGVAAEPPAPARRIWLLQRKTSKPGKNLGKTTGWIHRLNLKRRGIAVLSGVVYRQVDDAGLHITHAGEDQILAVENVVTCTGQVSNRDLADDLQAAGMTVHVIGGAFEARELDAKHAIRQGSELAAKI